jgi:beta-glucuronidase
MKSKVLKFLACCLTLAATSVIAGSNDDANLFVQNAENRSIFSLNGLWNIIVDPYENGYYNHRYLPNPDGYFKNQKMQTPSDLVEYNFDSADKIQVPGDWNTQQEKLFFYEGTIWYHKRFNVNKKKNKRYLVNFGAVNYQAIVYVNGEKVGSHEGGFTSFQFDITDQLNDKDNFIIVKVDNRRERKYVPTVNTDWWNYGGITRTVSLLELPETYLADYSIQLDNTQTDVIKVKLGVENFVNSSPKSISVNIPELNIAKKIELNENGEASINLKKSPKLWSPNSPKLYDVSLSYNGETINDKIGFRTIKTVGTDIILNGQSIYLKGISIHEESPLSEGRAWSLEDARTLLQWAKDLGCNFVRLAHYPHNEAMLRVADEMGLLVWSEIPVYWTVMFENPEVYTNAENQLIEMITRDKNRASIIMWSVANETPNHDARLAFLKKLIEKTKSLDSTRLVTAAMDTQSNSDNGKVVDDPLAKYVDVIGINSYCGWYFAKPETCSNLTWESHYEKPIIMSELGAGALQGKHGAKDERWTEEYQAAVYEHNLDMVKNINALRGLTPWILKDFRSPRRPLKDIQDFWNRKGLVSEKGVRKKAWYVLRDFYNSK